MPELDDKLTATLAVVVLLVALALLFALSRLWHRKLGAGMLIAAVFIGLLDLAAWAAVIYNYIWIVADKHWIKGIWIGMVALAVTGMAFASAELGKRLAKNDRMQAEAERASDKRLWW